MRHEEQLILRKQAAVDLVEGMSKEETARKYGRSVRWVEKLIKEFQLDITNQNRGKTAFSSFQILKDLYDEQLTMEEIGERHNVSKQRVSELYRKAKDADVPGLPMRS